MAGIGFTLRKLARRDDLMGPVSGLAYAAFVTSGPWIITVAAIAAINLLAARDSAGQELMLVRTLIIYNFAFSLALTGPFTAVATRFLSDQIFARDARPAPAALFAALAGSSLIQAPFVMALYLFVADISAPLAVLAIFNYFTVSAIWCAAVFLSALKDYRTVALAFVAGMIGAVILADRLLGEGAIGIFGGFAAGCALTLFILIARILAEYPYTLQQWGGLWLSFRRFGDLAIAGLAYNLAIWSDKWVMWFAPERILPPFNLPSYPLYDGAMFYAQLLLIPAMAVFVVSIETLFYARYRNFYEDIQNHAPLRTIRANHAALIDAVKGGARTLVVLQLALAALAILLSAALAGPLAMHAEQLGMFRFGALGAAFHGLFLFATIVLAYLDLRRQVMWLYLLFLALNAGLTALTLIPGFAWYGYGYFAAALLSFLAAATMMWRAVRNLPYLTFIGNNPAVRDTSRAHAAE